MRGLWVVVLLSSAMAAAGCTPSDAVLQEYSAGQTGCTPESNAISSGRALPNGYAWTAVCNNKTYLCTNLRSGKDNSQTSCAIAQ
jgi:hypothetical protein